VQSGRTGKHEVRGAGLRPAGVCTALTATDDAGITAAWVAWAETGVRPGSATSALCTYRAAGVMLEEGVPEGPSTKRFQRGKLPLAVSMCSCLPPSSPRKLSSVSWLSGSDTKHGSTCGSHELLSVIVGYSTCPENPCARSLGLLLAALGAQQRQHPLHFSFAIPRSRRS